jgi:hypothetical protein
MSATHSGCPFQYDVYDVLETTTIGNMVIATNKGHWYTLVYLLVVDGQLYEYVIQIIHF